MKPNICTENYYQLSCIFVNIESTIKLAFLSNILLII